MGAPEQKDQITTVALKIKGTIAGYPCELQGAFGGEDGLAIEGKISVNKPLGAFLNSLYLEFDETAKTKKTPFDAGLVPQIMVPSPSIACYGRTAAFLIRLDTEIPLGDKAPVEKLGLAFAFATLGGEGAAAKRRYVAGIRTTTPIELAKIGGDRSGIVGKLVGDIGIRHIGIYYASDDIEPWPLFDETGQEKLGFAGGFSFSAGFGSEESHIDIALPPPARAETNGSEKKTAELAPAQELTKPKESAPAVDDKRLRKWFEVKKTFGPLEVRRIGGEWHESKLGLLFDAGVELLGLKVGLAGLRVSVEPGKLANLTAKDLEIGLDGLEIAFKGGPVTIGGTFLKTPDGAYSGMAMICAEAFSITAIGSYATTTIGEPSLFIFGAYVGVMGGPPCFVVQGVAAGFGYNRALTVPNIEDVRDFPLVSMVLSPASGGSTNMVEKLGGNQFPVVQGQYWLAAGIKFTSFKLIDAFALVTVQFGTRFELALLGVASMQQPPKIEGASDKLPQPFVFVELALKVRFAPDDGVLAVRAQLTANSYLFDTRCRLTGGFAFLIWFKPTDPTFEDHSGDFVLTFGGYHPRFNQPAHYPQVPRVGFNWQMPRQGVTIKGECYFALTPSCIMGGCRLTATYRSGDFAAWFEAYADFIMAWEPFHYEADIGVWIGASYTLRVLGITSTLSFHLGASLSIWGPPFAGIARIDLGIVAFSVHIGERDVPRVPPPVKWEDFSGKFIPHADKKPAPLNVAITGGLLREDKDAGMFIVNPGELSLIVDAYIPVTELEIQGGCEPLEPQKELETKFGIRPMAEVEIGSKLKVWFRRTEDKDDKNKIPMRSRAITKGVPEALWSREPAPSPRGNAPIEAKVIKNALCGVRLSVPEMAAAREEPCPRKPVSVKEQAVKPVPFKPAHARPDNYKEEGEDPPEQLRRLLAENSDARKQAVTALRELGFELSADSINLEQMAACALQTDVLLALPQLAALGELPVLQKDQ